MLEMLVGVLKLNLLNRLSINKQVQQVNLPKLLLSDRDHLKRQQTKLAPHPGVKRGRQGSLGSGLLGGCSAVCMRLHKTTRFNWFNWINWVRPAEKDGPRRPYKQDGVLEVRSPGSRSRQQLGPRGIESKVHTGDQRSGNGGSPQQPCHPQDCTDWIK